jgi:hypothetical protein
MAADDDSSLKFGFRKEKIMTGEVWGAKKRQRRTPHRAPSIPGRLPLNESSKRLTYRYRRLPVENYFESRKSTQASRFVHTHILTKIHSTCPIVSSFFSSTQGLSTRIRKNR